jgi:hypothetical protein
MKTKKQKVYCENCKHFSANLNLYNYHGPEKCFFIKKKIDTPIRKSIVCNNCFKDNKNNNCKDYKVPVWICVTCNKEVNFKDTHICSNKNITEISEKKKWWKFW